MSLRTIYDAGFSNVAGTLWELACYYIWGKRGPTAAKKMGSRYVIEYSYGSSIYKIACKKKCVKGPMILSITDHLERDVTAEVKKFMGPDGDFHGLIVTPRDIGYESLCFDLLSGDMIFFGGDVDIKF